MDVRLDNPACTDSTGQANEPVEGGIARDAVGHCRNPHPDESRHAALRRHLISADGYRFTDSEFYRVFVRPVFRSRDVAPGNTYGGESPGDVLRPDANRDAATAAGYPDAREGDVLPGEPPGASGGISLPGGGAVAVTNLLADLASMPEPRRSWRDLSSADGGGGTANAGLGESGTALDHAIWMVMNRKWSAARAAEEVGMSELEFSDSVLGVDLLA